MALSFVWLVLLTYIKNSQCFDNTTEASPRNETVCQMKTCIPKCCPDGYVVYTRKKCMPYTTHDLDFSNMAVFDENATRQVSTVKEMMHLVPNKFSDEKFKNASFDLSINSNINLYLAETGVVYMEQPNSFYRWTKIGPEKFCVDYMAKRTAVPTPRFWIQVNDDPFVPKPYYPYVWLVPCVLLLGTLIMYPCSRQNRNLLGFMVMLFIFGLLKTFCFLFVMHLRRLTAEACIALTKAIYFSYLSTFCWLAVLSVRLWFLLSHNRMSNSNWIVFLASGSLAWGIPGIMTYGFNKMNSEDLRHMPWIITPNVPKSGCFLTGGEKFVYLHVPLLILLFCSVVFTLMSNKHLKGIYAPVPKHAESSDELPNGNKRPRFTMHMMKIAVMSIHVLLEIWRSLSPSNSKELITTIYNIFIGVAIFLILIVYPKIENRQKSEVFSSQQVQYNAGGVRA